MLNFPNLSRDVFLKEYWQKKPLFIPWALNSFKNPVSANELAGLAMEEDLESRLVIQTPGKLPQWRLQRGPFFKGDFKKLPPTHWTLLVQGVDRFIPEVCALLDHFNFLPQWRVDDVMISYAVEEGSVGPHYDHYDVFLYQAQGRRKWLLTTQDCHEANYLSGLELRIMKDFKIEQEYLLEEGDMLYLPPYVGHYGISQSKDCMTYSFGYRSYSGQELWTDFGDFLSSQTTSSSFYQDPPWTLLSKTSQLPEQAWLQAKALMQALLDDEIMLRDWFGGFATQLDDQAESLLPFAEEEKSDLKTFKQILLHAKGLVRNPLCRFAYYKSDKHLSLYINGDQWNTDEVSHDLVESLANNRRLTLKSILPFLDQKSNESFLYELWRLQWLEFTE